MSATKIPKIIHYCWFGSNEKPAEVINYINTWKEQLVDYEIKEWNEMNFDINKSCKYVIEAYKAGKWAFVTDYVRLKVLFEYGGIYLDTDVEVIKNYDALLDNIMFIGAEGKYSVCTATIGARKDSKIIKELLKLYDYKKFITANGECDIKPNSQLIYEFLNKEFGYTWAEKIQRFKECTIYPAEFFSPINCYDMNEEITDNTYSIHRFAGSWKTKKELIKNLLLIKITKIIGEEQREKIKKYCKKIKK